MLGGRLLVLAVVTHMTTEAGVTREFCNDVHFDLRDTRQAIADFNACVQFDRKQSRKLRQRFLSAWAKFATDEGVGAALRVLEDRNLREILLPEDVWKAVMSQSTSNRLPRKVSDGMKPIFAVEITLVVALALLTAAVAVWTLKLKSTVHKALHNENTPAFTAENDNQWEPEREKLLQECEPEQ